MAKLKYTGEFEYQSILTFTYRCIPSACEENDVNYSFKQTLKLWSDWPDSQTNTSPRCANKANKASLTVIFCHGYSCIFF